MVFIEKQNKHLVVTHPFKIGVQYFEFLIYPFIILETDKYLVLSVKQVKH